MSKFIGVWAPGTAPFETPTASGILIPAGARIVVQMHYHPQAEDATDATTSVDLRLTDVTPIYRSDLFVIGAVTDAPGLQLCPNDQGGPEFRIPVGAVNHTETLVLPQSIPAGLDVRLSSIFPHMHKIGVAMTVELERANATEGDPDKECLLGVPRWDFDYQFIYSYDVSTHQGPRVEDGDTIVLTCTYTNDPDANPALAELIATDPLIDSPRDVTVGEGSLDEMCLVIVGVTYSL